MIYIKRKKGLVHIYTGHGKGKTTAALGLALRAIGRGFKVYVIQFIKGKGKYGEHKIEKFLSSHFKIIQTGRGCIFKKPPDDCKNCVACHIDPKCPKEIDFKLAEKGLELSRKIINSKKYDLVILDEINIAIYYKLIKLKNVIKIIKEKPESVELVLTGRNAPKEIIEIADYVSEIKEVKHPYKKGIKARKGIEF